MRLDEDGEEKVKRGRERRKGKEKSLFLSWEYKLIWAEIPLCFL